MQLNIGFELYRPLGRSPMFEASAACLPGWADIPGRMAREQIGVRHIDDAKLRSNGSLGAILDTLIGPVLPGGSFSFSGDWRYYIGVGRLF